MIEGKQLKSQPMPEHGNGVRLAGLLATFTLVLSLLAAPLFS